MVGVAAPTLYTPNNYREMIESAVVATGSGGRCRCFWWPRQDPGPEQKSMNIWYSFVHAAAKNGAVGWLPGNSTLGDGGEH